MADLSRQRPDRPADNRLLLADQTLANAVGLLVAAVVFDAAMQAEAFDVAAEVVNAANWDHPHVGPMVRALRLIIDTHPDLSRPLSNQHAHYMAVLSAAWMGFARWRMANALSAFRAPPEDQAA